MYKAEKIDINMSIYAIEFVSTVLSDLHMRLKNKLRWALKEV